MEVFKKVAVPLLDDREPSFFRTETFSGYKRTDVRKALQTSLQEGRVEHACNWSVELICSGHFADIWDILLLHLGRFLHIRRPLIIPYVERRLSLFRNIIRQTQMYDTVLDLRNVVVVRQLLAEVVTVLSLMEKRPEIEEVGLGDDLMDLTGRLVADRPDYGVHEEPKELVIALNELSYHLVRTRSMRSACFWIEWVLAYLEKCHKRGEPLFCERRMEYQGIIDKKHLADPVWLLWETLARHSHTSGKQVMNSLLSLFQMRYAGLVTARKRKPLLYYAVMLLTDEGVTWQHELVTDKDKEICRVATQHVDKLYETLQGVCKRGVSNVSYRVSEKRRNLADSMQKMDMLAELDAAWGHS